MNDWVLLGPVIGIVGLIFCAVDYPAYRKRQLAALKEKSSETAENPKEETHQADESDR